MLARMGALLDLQSRTVCDGSLNQLKDLHMARAALMKDRTAAMNHARMMVLPKVNRHNGERLTLGTHRQMEFLAKAVDIERSGLPNLSAA